MKTNNLNLRGPLLVLLLFVSASESYEITYRNSYVSTASSLPYSYDYGIDHYGNNYGASEYSNGDATSGEYHVRLPDGRIQTVTYSVDDYSGFVADVEYKSSYLNDKVSDLPNFNIIKPRRIKPLHSYNIVFPSYNLIK